MPRGCGADNKQQSASTHSGAGEKETINNDGVAKLA